MNHGKSFFEFDFEDESDGTRRLFDLLDMLLIDSDDVVFVVDELEMCIRDSIVAMLTSLPILGLTSTNEIYGKLEQYKYGIYL